MTFFDEKMTMQLRKNIAFDKGNLDLFKEMTDPGGLIFEKIDHKINLGKEKIYESVYKSDEISQKSHHKKAILKKLSFQNDTPLKVRLPQN